MKRLKKTNCTFFYFLKESNHSKVGISLRSNPLIADLPIAKIDSNELPPIWLVARKLGKEIKSNFFGGSSAKTSNAAPAILFDNNASLSAS